MVFNAGQCPAKPEPVQTQTCWDGSIIPTTSTCPAQPATYTCWDGSLVYDQAQCPAQVFSEAGKSAALKMHVTNLCVRVLLVSASHLKVKAKQSHSYQQVTVSKSSLTAAQKCLFHSVQLALSTKFDVNI